jgi:ketosteroid isomerase-like protein
MKTPRFFQLLTGLMTLCMVVTVFATRATAEDRQSNPTDVKAIASLRRAVEVAFEKGDAKAVAALFTEDADMVEFDGRVHKGRAGIIKWHEEMFSGGKGFRIKFKQSSLRFVTPTFPWLFQGW